MKIALLGYGKMGKEIEKIALKRNHEVGVIIDNADDLETKGDQLAQCQVVFEFTDKDNVIQNLKKCFEAKVPVVCGTTGWNEQFPEIEALCKKNGNALFYSPNFSIGIYIFKEINKQLAQIMQNQPDYSPSIEELHHIHKKDAPSGTALLLAEEIINTLDRVTKWTASVEPAPDDLEIRSFRVGDVVGSHSIIYDSKDDFIEIRHAAKKRAVFANGALAAAEWLIGKKGVFSMKDLLNF